MSNLILARVDRARLALLDAKTTIEAKRVADMARAAEVFATKQKSQEARDYAHQIYVEALRLEGEFLERQDMNAGGRPASMKPVPKWNRFIPTLKEQGIGKKESVLAQSVCRAAKESPEIFQKVKNGGRLSEIGRHFKRLAHKEKLSNPAPTDLNPESPFQLILADPPWQYDHCEAGNREIENQYQTASVSEIVKHKPNVAKDAILFLWATAPKLPDAMQVMENWGFKYRTCAVWDKQKIGMGYWWRIRHELLLVGTCGNPGCTPECERRDSIFSEPRTKHSAKPKCVYEWIERAFPELKKLEMYGRVQRKGWTVWGNEANHE